MKKIKFILALTLLILIFSINCFAAENLQVFIPLQAYNLNPIFAQDNISRQITEQIFENLLTYNSAGKLVGELAKSWQIKLDGKLFEFELKPDIYFQQEYRNSIKTLNKGREITAKDWKWSFEYLASPANKSPFAFLLAPIKGYQEYRSGTNSEISGIKVIDKYHLTIELNKSQSSFLYNLADSAAVVLPEEDVKKDDFSFYPVGSGPFYLASNSRQQISLKKNNNYWEYNNQQQLPLIKELNFKIISKKKPLTEFDQQANILLSAAVVESGGQINTESYQLLKKPGNYLYTYVLTFNNLTSFSNSELSELRMAFQYLFTQINTADLDLKNYLTSDNFKQFFIKPADLYVGQEPARFEPVLTKLSRQNKSLIMKINNNPFNFKIAKFIQSKLQQAGIKLVIKANSWPEQLNYAEQVKTSDIYLYNYSLNNKHLFLQQLADFNQFSNQSNFNQDRFTNLLAYRELENSASKRDQAYQRILKIVNNDLNIYFLQQADPYYANNELSNSQIFKNRFLANQYKYLSLDFIQ